jgi:hypothetical protein
LSYGARAGKRPSCRAAKPGDYVLANRRRFTTMGTIDQPGRHTRTVWTVDSGVILNKTVPYTGAPGDSYLGPPASDRR